MLATVKVEDFDRFLENFSTKGAEKRKEHGSDGATVYRDPEDEQRVWIVFDWNVDGLNALKQSPDSAELFKSAGLQGPPMPLEPVAELPS
jgi:hypothetical protein